MNREALAILGMSCRFPGAPNLESYWRLLKDGVDAITVVPRERWDLEHFFDPDIDAPGKLVTRWGGFLERPDHFDAEFFGMLADEAQRVDPQQRLALELAWEALEDACIPPDSLSGKDVGVFMGVSHSDYERIIYKETAGICAHDGPGAYHALTANRVSFALNLKGPSLVVDGACCSSLAAIHVAAQHLLLDECSLAIVGGVNLNLTPEETIGLTKARMMSPRGRCMTFDGRADGYVRGEGIGVVILKRASAAERDGDRVRAMIRGSAVNHNGRSNGVTAPNGPAQQELLKTALRRADVSPASVTYVEVHGTGTTFGDPIEVGALKAVFDGGTDAPPCAIGTVKTNIGHLEAASGMAGVIKVVLAFERGLIPQNLHFESMSSYIDLTGTRLRVADRALSWPAGRKLAGVSAFGFGGANAHVVLEEQLPPSEVESTSGPALLLLSARDRRALQDVVARYGDFLKGNPEARWSDICHSSIVGRTHFAQRLALVVSSRDELLQRLTDHNSGRLDAEPRQLKVRRQRVGLCLGDCVEFSQALAGESSVYRAILTARAAALPVSDSLHAEALSDFLRYAGVSHLQVERGSLGGTASEKTPLTLLVTLGLSSAELPALPGASRLGWDGDLPPLHASLRLLGELYELGAAIDFAALGRLNSGNKISLPTYPFKQVSHWVQPAQSPKLREASHG